MKFEVINANGRCMQSTEYPECVPYDMLDNMAEHGYKFRVNGKIVAKNRVKSAILGTPEVVDKLDTTESGGVDIPEIPKTKSTRSRGEVICIEDNKRFISQSEAATFYNISAMSVSKSIKEGKPVKGHTFKKV